MDNLKISMTGQDILYDSNDIISKSIKSLYGTVHKGAVHTQKNILNNLDDFNDKLKKPQRVGQEGKIRNFSTSFKPEASIHHSFNPKRLKFNKLQLKLSLINKNIVKTIF